MNPRYSPFPFVDKLNLVYDVPFLQDKGIRPETAELFEVGLCTDEGYFKDFVVIRVHDPAGVPIFYQARRTDRARIVRFGRWRNPTNWPREKLLYNCHRVMATPPKYLVLLEDAWSVLRMHQLQIPAVASFGPQLSPLQRSFIQSVPKIICVYDGDTAGKTGSRMLRNQFDVTPMGQELVIVELPNKKDADELTDPELMDVLSSHVVI
jgi:hypothetical protein